jgi:hypothetical protein
MNIIEFAKEHLLHEKYNGDGDVIEGDYYEFDPEELQKFAELIIFECIKLAVFKGDSSTGKAIKEHFGVEE